MPDGIVRYRPDAVVRRRRPHRARRRREARQVELVLNALERLYRPVLANPDDFPVLEVPDLPDLGLADHLAHLVRHVVLLAAALGFQGDGRNLLFRELREGPRELLSRVIGPLGAPGDLTPEPRRREQLVRPMAIVHADLLMLDAIARAVGLGL